MENQKESPQTEAMMTPLNEKDAEAALQAALKEIAEKLPDENLKMHEETLRKIFIGHQLPKDAMGFDDTFLEILYAFAFNKFKMGKYEDAAVVYRFLLTVNPIDFRYPFALAACYQKKKEYLLATSLYMQAAVLDTKNPMPFYHASDCFLKLNNPFLAMMMLEMTSERLGKSKEALTLKARVDMTMEALKIKIDKILNDAALEDSEPAKTQ